jgi:endonuclease YncB( thermonuclease family)
MLSALFLATVIGISDGDTLTVLSVNKQQDAKSAGRGLWSEPSPMPPWEWRQSVRHGVIQLLRYA